jgi:hypothetical protein
MAVRNFFSRLFNPSAHRQSERQKTNTNITTDSHPQTTETATIITTTTTVATSNPPTLP